MKKGPSRLSHSTRKKKNPNQGRSALELGPLALDPHVTPPQRDIHTIGVVAFNGAGSSVLDGLHKWSKQNPETALVLNRRLASQGGKLFPVRSDAFLRSRTDLLLSLGGDGTFLSAARLVRGTGVPILGVNLGKVGFLADVPPENLARILDEILRREYSLRHRMMLQVEVYEGDKKVNEDLALNDVAFAGRMGFQMVNLRVSAHGQFLTEYYVDGLLVSTPTGSTAYALSAGGPIIHPSVHSILLTPLSPSSLSVRPLVLPDYHVITVEADMDRKQEVNLVIDGRTNIPLKKNQTVVLRKSEVGTCILRPKSSSYFESLRGKLGWSGSALRKG